MRVNTPAHENILGVSYVGAPKSHTAVFIVKKIQNQIVHLSSVQGCLVFAETGLEVPPDLLSAHEFEFSPHPQLAYARFAERLEQRRLAQERAVHYRLVDGAYISETATIGKNAVIEPGCLIGHGVVIGDDAVILAGAVIKNAVIGNRLRCGEGAVIGSASFTLTEDEAGHRVRIPALGGVTIGDNVQIGVNNNIARGCAGDTVIGNYVKTDSLVYIGHDACLEDEAEIAAGCVVGGFATVEKGAFLGFNASIRNRIALGCDCVIGMGAVVTKSVDSNAVMVGNPAKLHLKQEQ